METFQEKPRNQQIVYSWKINNEKVLRNVTGNIDENVPRNAMKLVNRWGANRDSPWALHT